MKHPCTSPPATAKHRLIPRWAAHAALAACLLAATPARATEIVVLCSTALQSTLTELTPQYQAATGDKLIVTYQSSAPLKTSIETGTAFDVAILTPAMIADLAKSGRVIQGSARTLARANIGIAVQKGAPKPDISTPNAFKAALLAAHSVASSVAGQSRVGLLAALDKLGIAAEVNVKTKLITTGSTGEAVARGEAELAVQLIPELQAVAGLDVVGPFPAGLQSPVVLTAGVAAAAKAPTSAARLVAYLASPDRADLIRAKGLEPGIGE